MSEFYRVTKAAPPGIEPGKAMQQTKPQPCVIAHDVAEKTSAANSAESVSSRTIPPRSKNPGTGKGPIGPIDDYWFEPLIPPGPTGLGGWVSSPESTPTDFAKGDHHAHEVQPVGERGVSPSGWRPPVSLTGEAARNDEQGQRITPHQRPREDGGNVVRSDIGEPEHDRRSPFSFLARSVTIAPDWRARLPAGVTVEDVERDLAPRAVGR